MTTPQTATLSDWLLSCIAEDEAAAVEVGYDAERMHLPDLGAVNVRYVMRKADDKRLAVCAAHRRIVELHRWSADVDWSEHEHAERTSWLTARDVLRALATAYADRPGFQEAWA